MEEVEISTAEVEPLNYVEYVARAFFILSLIVSTVLVFETLANSFQAWGKIDIGDPVVAPTVTDILGRAIRRGLILLAPFVLGYAAQIYVGRIARSQSALTLFAMLFASLLFILILGGAVRFGLSGNTNWLELLRYLGVGLILAGFVVALGLMAQENKSSQLAAALLMPAAFVHLILIIVGRATSNPNTLMNVVLLFGVILLIGGLLFAARIVTSLQTES
jgi:hypothetical protein